MRLGPASSRQVFRERQARFKQALMNRGVAEACLVAGFARPRNFAHNVFPFRAESHFLYLVGRSLEGAILALERGEVTLYVQRSPPEAALWTGPEPSLAALESELEMAVRPLAEYLPEGETATLPPQDAETAEWLSSHLDRSIEAQSGSEVTERDAELAETMVELRLRHDPAALAQLAFAAEVSVEAHLRGMRAIRGAEYEFEIVAEIEAGMRRANLGPSYASIVTVRGEILHNTSTSGRLSDGELLLCDAGAESLEGFAGDITRTSPVRGRFEGAPREAYQAVLAVQNAVLPRVQAGASFAELHYFSCLEMARQLTSLGLLRGAPELLVETGAVAVFYPHGLGHLLGLDVHDMEDLGDRAGYGPLGHRRDHPAFRALRLIRTLEADMVVTIEPGFYVSPLLLERARRDPAISSQIVWARVEDFSRVGGIRIEDDVCVTTEGPRVLSAGVPKECDEVEALLRA